MTSRLPRAVTVLSGFLGSGKTTLLRRHLDAAGASGTAVVINELGAVGVDHHLARVVAERSVLLQNGCACCIRREDLVETFRGLLDRDEQNDSGTLRHVIVETTGLADPVPIQFTLATDPVLRHHFSPARVIVTLDALNGPAQIVAQPEAAKQILAADCVVITKPDIAEAGAVRACRDLVAGMNPAARIIVSRLGGGFAVLAPAPPRAAGTAPTPPRTTPLPDAELSREGPHRAAGAVTLGFSGSIDWPAFGVWLGMLLEAHGPEMLRIKGLLDIGDAGPVVMNTAQHVVHPPEHLPRWPEGERHSFLVFIARNLDTARIAGSLEAFQRAGGRNDFQVWEFA